MVEWSKMVSIEYGAHNIYFHLQGYIQELGYILNKISRNALQKSITVLLTSLHYFKFNKIDNSCTE